MGPLGLLLRRRAYGGRRAVIVDLADAVKDALAAATLSRSFAPVRAYVPAYGKQESDADELADLLVTVVPRDLSLATETRSSHVHDYVIDVAIQQRISQDARSEAEVAAECDPLMLVAEEVMDLFRGKQVTVPAGRPTCVAAANRPTYEPAHLDQFRVFTSVVSLTYRLSRAMS